eukprot:m.340098 g.340098  ORF g.340098 m.340098 type:complete len:500 (+) comp19132_c0_seq1:132-1631(+)
MLFPILATLVLALVIAKVIQFILQKQKNSAALSKFHSFGTLPKDKQEKFLFFSSLPKKCPKGTKCGTVKMPMGQVVYIINPNLARVVMKKAYRHPLVEKLLGHYGTQAALNLRSDKSEWVQSRKFFDSLLATKHLRSYVDMSRDVINNYLDGWEARLAASEPKPGETEKSFPIDLQAEFNECVMQVSMNLLFGETNSDELEKDWPKAFVKMIEYCDEELMRRVSNPVLLADFIHSRTSTGKTFHKYCASMQNTCSKMLDARLREYGIEPGKEVDAKELRERVSATTNPDILDHLLTFENENGSPVTRKLIIDHIITFLGAAYGTTYFTTSLTLYNIGDDADVQEQCLQEALKIENWTYDEISHLSVIPAAINETLRITPPVPNIPRILEEDLIIEGNVVPKGTQVNISTLACNRCPDVFPSPDKFDLNNTKDGRAKHISFASSPHTCPGMRLSEQLIRVMVGLMITRFNFKPEEEIKMEIGQTLLRSSTGIKVRVYNRK